MITKMLRTALVAAALIVPASSGFAAQDLDEPRVEVTWLGGASLAFQFNGLKILTDPVFGEGAQAFTMGDPNEMFDLEKGPNIRTFERLTALPDVEPESFDVVVLSHTHEDHFDQTAQSLLPENVPMIAPPADVAKVRGMGFQRVGSLAWGESRTFKAGVGEVVITAVNAHHSTNAGMGAVLGVGNGYWLAFKQGGWRRTVYWTGDTFPTEDVVATVRALGAPDVMIPHVGAVGVTGPLGQITMGAEDVVKFAKAVSAKKVLPVHHSTYPLYLEPISRLAGYSAGQAFALDLVSAGTTLQY